MSSVILLGSKGTGEISGERVEIAIQPRQNEALDVRAWQRMSRLEYHVPLVLGADAQQFEQRPLRSLERRFEVNRPLSISVPDRSD